MSVVFVVGSEEQLRSGAMWCKTIAHTRNASVHVLVVGSERKALPELAKRKLSDDSSEDSNLSVMVSTVAADVQEIVAQLKASRCCTLVMVYAEDQADLQQSLFEACTAPAVWMRAVGPPPESGKRLFGALSRPAMVTTNICEKLFGFAPAAVLPDPIEDPADADAEIAERVLAHAASNAGNSGDLVIVGVGHPARENLAYRVGLRLMEAEHTVCFALIHDGDSLHESVGAQIRDWFASVAPPMDRGQRTALAEELESGSQPNLEFLGLISAAAMLAAFGLLQDSAAVIIGAMLIAPLMTPIVGAGLALTVGNRPLFRSALRSISFGFIGALVASVSFGLLVRLLQEGMHIQLMAELSSTGEMLARCRPSPLDFCVGLVGGIAASYSRTREHLSAALAGAAIAAALVPPISTAGLQIAFGQWTSETPGVSPVIGPLLIVSVNVLTIMLGSAFVLWARGMRADRKLPAQARWVMRAVIVILLLALLAMISVITPTAS